MARTIRCAAPDPNLLGPRRAPLFDLTIAVVTPLFGGSARPGETDGENPVRAASVRGHLRFWWRARKGAQYATADDLFKAEERIWGSTKRPGLLSVTVETLHPGDEVACATYEKDEKGKLKIQWRTSYPPYALFPFQGELADGGRRVDVPPAHAREEVRFRLRIGAVTGMDDVAGKELQEAAEAAIWAWCNFGGIGARTRRGCGSLYCGDARFRPDATMQLGVWLSQMMARCVVKEARHLPIAVLSEAQLVVGRERTEPIRCWERAIDVIQSFRQFRGSRPGGRGAGRSLWPEAEAIRQAWRGSLPDTAYFPRADLGLPIITHFKQNPMHSEPTDDGTLQAGVKGTERMASPLILKPLALSPTQAIPLALCLNAPHIWERGAPGAVLSFNRRPSKQITAAQLYDRTRSTLVQPLHDNNASMARDAFMNFALSQLRGERVTLP